MDNTNKHLQDILTAVEEIDSFFGAEHKLFNEIVINHLPKLKVEVTELLK